MLQEIVFSAKKKFFFNETSNGDSKLLAWTLNRNLNDIGYTLSPQFIETLSESSNDDVIKFSKEVLEVLVKKLGSDKKYKPFYVNFPDELFVLSDLELYSNAYTHYFSVYLSEDSKEDFTYFPPAEKQSRIPLVDFTRLKVINRYDGEVQDLFTDLVCSNSSLTQKDKEYIAWLCENKPVTLPKVIPQKETKALLLGHFRQANIDTSFTDVLRTACYLSGGDVSLATNTKFKLKNKDKNYILSLLEKSHNSEELWDRPEVWKKLARCIHIGAKKTKWKELFSKLYNGNWDQTFNAKLEKSIKEKDTLGLIDLGNKNPGSFTRRLDHVLRTFTAKQEIVQTFKDVVDKVSTPVLLQCLAHFRNRPQTNRVIFPKGNAAKIWLSDKKLPELDVNLRIELVDICKNSLIKRFKNLPKLGKCYLSPKLVNYLVPYSLRSASEALNPIVRGSKVPIGNNNIVRLFIWWKNGDSRVDIDLSAKAYDKDFNPVMDIAYYSLKALGCYHSGDVTTAPNGASEFIDIDISKVVNSQSNVRYVGMCINNYTGQTFDTVPECSAGWMTRVDAASGEAYEPKTVKNRFAVQSHSTVAIPMLLDLVEHKIIWVDINTKGRAINNVKNNFSITTILKGMTDNRKLDLHTLLWLHILARGEFTENKEDAQTIFDIEDGITPYDHSKIMSEFMK